MGELEGTDDLKLLYHVVQIVVYGVFMHNLIPHNQLSSEDDHDDLLAEYYECLIDCEDTASSCKRICREVLV